MSAGEAAGEGFNGSVCREGGGRDGRRVCGRVGVYGEEMTMGVVRVETCGFGKADLCKEETLDDRPPKDDAMVLNSTCLISGLAVGSEGS